jgi:putative transposase
VVKPSRKRPVVRHLVEQHRLSVRRACALVGLSRTVYAYRAREPKDEALRSRLKTLATTHSRYGYLLLHGLLKAEGLVVNRKHTYRLYREEGLQVRTKKRKKLDRPRMPMEVPTRPNQRWSMDFVSDQLANGRRFRVLNVIDDFSREVVGQLVGVSISGHRVARFLTELGEERELPASIVSDNGPEFTGKAMFDWAEESGTRQAFIQPGKPTQNAFVESLTGKFRNECLNQHWFRSLEHAKEKIDRWREHYNQVRPHSTLGYLPPARFAAQAA